LKDLTQGSPGKLILYFAFPMLIGNVFQQLYNVVDSAVVGKFIGEKALAAVGASFPIFYVLIALIIGVASGNMVIISQYYGAKMMDKVKQAIDTFYITVFAASIFISVFGIYFSEDIFRLMDLPEELMADATLYLNIFLAGVVAMFGYNSTSSILRGLGDSKTPLYFLIISSILNVVFDLLFVLVFHWGIAGVAWATVLSQAIAFIVGTIYLNKKHEVIRISLKTITFDKEIFIKSLKLGLPSGFQQLFVALGMMALYKIVNPFGTEVIAAYSVAGRLDGFAVMPAMNLTAALTTFVGQNIGANKIDRVKEGLYVTLAYSVAISLFFTIIILLWGEDIMYLFTSDAGVVAIGYKYLQIVGYFYFTFSIMFSFLGVFRGAGDTLIPMVITLFSMWLFRVPAAYFLSKILGTDGIWWSIPTGWIFGLFASIVYFKMGRWKNKSIV